MTTGMQTYEVTCSVCGELRWPRLPERPTTYTCGRCTSAPPEKRQARVEAGRRRAAARRRRGPVKKPGVTGRDFSAAPLSLLSPPPPFGGGLSRLASDLRGKPEQRQPCERAPAVEERQPTFGRPGMIARVAATIGAGVCGNSLRSTIKSTSTGAISSSSSRLQRREGAPMGELREACDGHSGRAFLDRAGE